MKRYLVAAGCIVILNCWGCALTTQLNTEEYVKISTVAVLTDASVTESNTMIDIIENQNAAKVVVDTVKLRLAEKGLTVNAQENVITVGSIYRDEAEFMVKNNAERNMSGQNNGLPPPYFIDAPSFQEKMSQLIKLFRNLNRPQADVEIRAEPKPQEASYSVPYIKDLGLSSDAALIIKMHGVVYRREEIMEDFAKKMVIGLLTRSQQSGGRSDSASLELFLLNVRTGEVLWTATFYGGAPSAEMFNDRLDDFINKLPSLKKDGTQDKEIAKTAAQ